MLDNSGKKQYTVNELLEIMEKLRSENGCPWDKEQDHKSIRNNFIEEVYEAVEAIDNSDVNLLREELGDVLLQVVFHAQMEKETGNFTFDDVVDELCTKLVIRHPHVFGEVNVSNTGEVLDNWEKIKNDVKGTKSHTEKLKNVPKVLPALMRAEKIGNRARKAGMDLPDVKSCLDSLESEFSEVKVEITSGDKEKLFEEVGDLLLACVNLARKLDINSEEALSFSCDKFINRFECVEDLTRLEGIEMSSLSIDELNSYWVKAKNREI